MDPIMLVAGNAAAAGEQPEKTRGISLEPGAPSFGELLLLLKPLEGAQRKASATVASTAGLNTAHTVMQQNTAVQPDPLAEISGKDLLGAVGDALKAVLGGLRSEVAGAVENGLSEISSQLKGKGLPQALVAALPQLGEQVSEVLAGSFPGVKLLDIALDGLSGDKSDAVTADGSKLAAADPGSGEALAAEDHTAMLQPEGSELISWLSSVLETAGATADSQLELSVAVTERAIAPAAAQTAQIALPDGSLSLSLQEVPVNADAMTAETGADKRQFSLLLTDRSGGELRASLTVSKAEAAPQIHTPVPLTLPAMPGQPQPLAPLAVSGQTIQPDQSLQAATAKAPAPDTPPQAAPAASAVQPAVPPAPQQGAAAVSSPQAVLAGAQAAAEQVPATEEAEPIETAASGMAFKEEEAAAEEVATFQPRRRTLPDSTAVPGYASGAQLRSEAELSRFGSRRQRFSAELAMSPLGSLEQSGPAAGGAQISLDTQAARLIEFSSPAQKTETAALPQLNHRVMAERVMEHAARFKAAGDGLYIAHLSLNPENLGEMHVNISVRGDNVALQIAVVSTVAREQLQSSLNALRQSLVDGGLNVAELRVINIKPDERGSGNQRRQEQQNQGNADDNNRGGIAAAKETSPLPG